MMPDVFSDTDRTKMQSKNTVLSPGQNYKLLIDIFDYCYIWALILIRLKNKVQIYFQVHFVMKDLL